MSKTRFTQWIVLACIGSLAACTSGEGGTAGNTELNVIVPNGYDAGSSAPALIDIQDVEYTVDCAGNNDTFLDNDDSFADEVTLNGNLEVQDGRTNAEANRSSQSVNHCESSRPMPARAPTKDSRVNLRLISVRISSPTSKRTCRS